MSTLTDDKFWEIAGSQEFHERFKHRLPIHRLMGERDRYNVDSLDAELTALLATTNQPRGPRDAFYFPKRVQALKDAIAQVMWIERQFADNPTKTWVAWEGPPKPPERPKKTFADWAKETN